MSNHIHLLIKPIRDENLSKIMQWILSVFAVRYNKLYGYHGHVWYDRFKSNVIVTFRQFLRAFQYIMENPVRAGIVSKPVEYPCNGITFIRNRQFDFLEIPDPIVRFSMPLLLIQQYLPA